MITPVRKWLRLFLGVLFAAGIALITDGGAAAQDMPAHAYVSRRWQVRDGLPHPVVYNIVQGKRGYMWMATFGGLTRFDGRDFSFAGSADAPISPDESVRNVAVEDNETLIVLPQSGGVFRYRDGQFAVHPVSSDIASLSLLDVFVQPDGVLWLGAADGTLVRWEAGRTMTFDWSDQLSDPTIRFSFAIDAAGRTWAARGRFLGWYQSGEMVPYADPIGEGICIGPGKDGRLWVGSTEGLFRFDGSIIEDVPLDRAWPALQSGLTQLFEDSRGFLWVGTWRQGLFRVTNGRWFLVDDSYEYITSVIEDTEGNIWVSSGGGGIARWRTRDFLVLDSTVGLPRDASLSVCVDDAGGVWCANRSGGVVRLLDGVVQGFTTAAGKVPFVTAVCPDRTGRIWVGTTDGMFTIDASDPGFLVRQSGSYGIVSLLYCADNDDMWVNSSLGGLRVFRGDVLVGTYGTTHGVPATRLSGIAQDRTGAVWVSTLRGELLRLDDRGEFFERRGPDIPGFSGEIYAISRDDRGDIWGGTSQGLMYCGGSACRLLGTAQGMPDSKISQVLEDERGRLWLGSRNGLWHANLDDLRAVINGKLAAVAGVSVGENEGLPLAASLPSMQPRAWADQSGRLWFATYAGVIGVGPETSVPARPAPPVYIEEVYLDGNLLPDPKSLAVPPGRHAVEFRFSAPTYTAPHLVRLRHRLVGFDGDWVRTPDDRGVQYGRLPPGQYLLRVAARNVNGEWGTDEATLSFEVQPAWWQNYWVLGGGTLALLGVIIAAVRGWTQQRYQQHIQRMERVQVLERERARIARDLHDEVGTSLTRVGFMAERLKRHAPSGELKTDLDQLAAQTRRVTADLESIVWTVNPKNQTWDRFALYLSRYAQEMFRDSPVRCSVEGDDEIPGDPLPPDAQRHLLAIYKEGLNNVLKHAKAGRVEVAMTLQQGRFRLQIRDDGIGFDRALEQDTLRNGLRNMHARMDEMSGELTIETKPGAGTCIVCSVRTLPPGNT